MRTAYLERPAWWEVYPSYWKRQMEACLEHCLDKHPAATAAAAMAVIGVGSLLAVGLAALTLIAPFGILLGWF